MNGTRNEKPYPLDHAALDKFMAKVVIDAQGCWRWQGARNHKGYGYFHHGKSVSAHRASHRHFKGEISEGFDIDHLCSVRDCVNPDHLEAVTHQENVLRGQTLSSINKRKTHCIRGHEFTPENTLAPSRDHIWRECAACRLETNAARRADRRPCRFCGTTIRFYNMKRHERNLHPAELQEITPATGEEREP